MSAPDDTIRRQYETADPLRVRMDTHRLYEQRRVDLDVECAARLALAGSESLLDVGCGPGAFLRWLRAHGHVGRLVGLDQSEGMIRAASAAAMPIEWQVGDVAELPYAAGEFDWASARHMLYHVPDIPGALRELARVVGPAGGLLVTTNARESLAEIRALTVAALTAFGLPADPSPTDRFSIGNADDFLAAVFGRVEKHVIANALVIPTAEPVVRYVVSTLTMLGVPEDPALRTEMTVWLVDEASQRIAERGGVWRDPKDVAIYVCRGR